MPKPRIDIDISRVEEYAAQGLTQAEICLCLGISERTLYNYKRESADFADAIKRGQAKAASEVANVLYLKATKDKDLGAIIWWEKTRRGLSDKTTHVLSDGVDWSKVPQETLEAYRAGKVSLDDVRRSISTI